MLNQSIHYNNLPLGLINQITELSNQGLLTEYSDIGFLAMGKDNSWILESKGWIWSEGIDPGLLAALQEVDESVSAVVCLFFFFSWRARDVCEEVLTGLYCVECQALNSANRLLVD